MHKILKCETLEVIFAAVLKLRFVKVLDWVPVHITIKYSKVGGCPDMVRVIKAFVRNNNMVVDPKAEKRPQGQWLLYARMIIMA
jgi:hypothetical protein